MTTRRAFLQTGVAAAAGGALLVGFHIPDVTAATTKHSAGRTLRA